MSLPLAFTAALIKKTGLNHNRGYIRCPFGWSVRKTSVDIIALCTRFSLDVEQG